MSAVTNTIGWVVTLACFNWLAWKMTGFTPVWGMFCAVGKEMSVYAHLVSAGLLIACFIGGLWYGTKAFLQCLAVLAFWLVIPELTAAIFAFGRKCS